MGELQLIRLIGKGAAARVYLASDGQKVKAVKVFPASGIAHAERELELGRNLEHPNLNSVEELHVLDGQPALVMPFVQGSLLTAWLKEHKEPLDFLQLLPGLLDTLEYLADRRIVHRDVKPENVIVTGDGRATLIDYDLATRSGSGEPPARVAGTLAFLSPEQAGAQAVTPASDLYSLGILAWWGLCREVPFSGEPAAVLAAHLNNVPPPVSALKPELAGFDPLIAALLAKQPEARPGHSEARAEMQRQLGHFA